MGEDGYESVLSSGRGDHESRLSVEGAGCGEEVVVTCDRYVIFLGDFKCIDDNFVLGVGWNMPSACFYGSELLSGMLYLYYDTRF